MNLFTGLVEVVEEAGELAPWVAGAEVEHVLRLAGEVAEESVEAVVPVHQLAAEAQVRGHAPVAAVESAAETWVEAVWEAVAHQCRHPPVPTSAVRQGSAEAEVIALRTDWEALDRGPAGG